MRLEVNFKHCECLKITRNVAFEFGIFANFYLIKTDLFGNTVWLHVFKNSPNWTILAFQFTFAKWKCKRTSLRSQWDFSVIFKHHVVTKHFMDRLLQFHHHSGPKTDCHCFFLHFLSIFDMQELIVWGLEHKQLFFRALGIAAKPEWRRRRSSIGTTLTLTFQVSSVCLKTYFFPSLFSHYPISTRRR